MIVQSHYTRTATRYPNLQIWGPIPDFSFGSGANFVQIQQGRTQANSSVSEKNLPQLFLKVGKKSASESQAFIAFRRAYLRRYAWTKVAAFLWLLLG